MHILCTVGPIFTIWRGTQDTVVLVAILIVPSRAPRLLLLLLLLILRPLGRHRRRIWEKHSWLISLVVHPDGSVGGKIPGVLVIHPDLEQIREIGNE